MAAKRNHEPQDALALGARGIAVSTSGQLSYSLVVDGQPILLTARLGPVLRDEGSLGNEARFVGASQRTIDTTWTNIPGGKRRVVRDHANELTVKFVERRVTRSGRLKLRLSPAGGFAGVLKTTATPR